MVFIHASGDGQVGGFYFLATVNNAAMTIHVLVFVSLDISISSLENVCSIPAYF